MENVILTDCDGVLLNWVYAFDVWMEERGYEIQNLSNTYDISHKYGMNKEEKMRLIRFFNESAAIGFLPPLRDAIHYVKKLHEEHGFIFHAITSLSNNTHAQNLRIRNLQKLFGETVFDKFIFLDTGADKDEVLAQYKDTECYWLEDKVENALEGYNHGLRPLLMEHAFNMNEMKVPRVKNWKEIYEIITGN